MASPSNQVDRLFAIVGSVDRLFVAMGMVILISSGIGILLALVTGPFYFFYRPQGYCKADASAASSF